MLAAPANRCSLNRLSYSGGEGDEDTDGLAPADPHLVDVDEVRPDQVVHRVADPRPVSPADLIPAHAHGREAYSLNDIGPSRLEHAWTIVVQPK